ncbi:hypothetical protein [Bosea sp. BH3]|uniref:hypothetical protein n=1 Tax=Bosea sp. BH3 TaxID=2871701 RepID=UPI0021CB1D79|nr:hypothetical protein [Bosea sp. BH3]MCU4178617.1 hypothetical protein [Bosea sp. BH3]
MARPTDRERKQAKIEDGDPAAPLFDAVDRMHHRLSSVLSDLRGMTSVAAQEVVVPHLRRSLLRGFLVLSILSAIGATGVGIAVVGSIIRAADTRAIAKADALDDERSRSFLARAEKRAAELAASSITEANARAVRAETAATNAKATVLAVVGKGGDEDVRALLSALVTAPRGDLHVLWRVMRNPDPNVRRLALRATEMSSGEINRILQYLDNGGR